MRILIVVLLLAPLLMAVPGCTSKKAETPEPEKYSQDNASQSLQNPPSVGAPARRESAATRGGQNKQAGESAP